MWHDCLNLLKLVELHSYRLNSMLYKFCFNKAVKIVEKHFLKSFKTVLLRSSFYNFFQTPSFLFPRVPWTVFLKFDVLMSHLGILKKCKSDSRFWGGSWESAFLQTPRLYPCFLLWGPHSCRKYLGISPLGWPVWVTWFPW